MVLNANQPHIFLKHLEPSGKARQIRQVGVWIEVTGKYRAGENALHWSVAAAKTKLLELRAVNSRNVEPRSLWPIQSLLLQVPGGACCSPLLAPYGSSACAMV